MTCFFSNKILKPSKTFIRSYFLLIASAVVLLSLVYSCEENPTSIGAGLLPGEDKANVYSRTDLELNLYTMYIDSVRSNDTLYIAGDYYSPYFGTTTAEIITQLNLLYDWDEEEVITIDSVFLILTIQDYYGDTVTAPFLTLYEISELLNKDSVYYSNKPVQHERIITTVALEGIKSDTTLKIPVSIAFGAYLLRDTSMLFIKSPPAGQPPTDFRSFFKGLHYLLVSNTEASFMVLNPISSANGIQINYSTPTVARKTFNFVFSQKNAFYRRVTRDFTTAELGKEIQHINDMVLDSMVYLQGHTGVFPRISIPQLDLLKAELPLAINKARLTIPAFLDGEDYTDLKVAKTLYLMYIDAAGNKVVIPDMNVGGVGRYNATKHEYTFDLAIFVQEYIEGNISLPEIDIFLPGTIQHSAIFKANNATVKPKLELTFSKF